MPVKGGPHYNFLLGATWVGPRPTKGKLSRWDLSGFHEIRVRLGTQIDRAWNLFIKTRAYRKIHSIYSYKLYTKQTHIIYSKFFTLSKGRSFFSTAKVAGSQNIDPTNAELNFKPKRGGKSLHTWKRNRFD